MVHRVVGNQQTSARVVENKHKSDYTTLLDYTHSQSLAELQWQSQESASGVWSVGKAARGGQSASLTARGDSNTVARCLHVETVLATLSSIKRRKKRMPGTPEPLAPF